LKYLPLTQPSSIEEDHQHYKEDILKERTKHVRNYKDNILKERTKHVKILKERTKHVKILQRKRELNM